MTETTRPTPRQMAANVGELCLWLQEDEIARGRFSFWYNMTASRLGVDKPHVTKEMVDVMARAMFEITSELLVL